MQLKKVVEPFGEVNVYPADGGKTRVVATILMEPHREGAQTGIALDGSGSMAKLYGVEDGSRVLSPIFGGSKKLTNEVAPVAQKLCAYLARKIDSDGGTTCIYWSTGTDGSGGGGFLASLFGMKKELHNEITPVAQKLCGYLARKIDADGGTTCIYWATGVGGSKVEVIGDLTADDAERHIFGPPRDFGTGTQLLPAVKYFVDRFKDAPWGIYVFITDGELHDLDPVKEYSTWLAREVSAKRRNPLKFVLIGVGPAVNEQQMEELDDLDTGTEVDLCDHKLAAEMRVLQ